MNNKYKIISYHIVFWLAYMLLGSLLEYVQDPAGYFFSIADIFFTQFPNICSVYLCILVCFKYGNPLKSLQLVFGIILVFVFSFGNWYTTAYHIRPHISAVGPTPPPFNFIHFGASVLWVFIRYSILGFGYYFASEGIKFQKKLRLIEKEKHEAEYAFLRAQINPHFLNNTLNFFFAKSLPLSEELANGIMTLSEIMHYSLEIDKDDRMTLIEEEIEHIKNVIKINQLRFNHKLQIDFQIEGNTHNVRVIPLILITVVENILKHGNCTDKDYPVKIFLNINEGDGYVYLNTYNQKKKGPKELSSGIGLDNIKKRLAHHYHKKFILNITETEQDYRLDLSIPFSIIAESKQMTSHINFIEQLHLQALKPKPYTS
ncbi:sensor histidine kinase [Pedobacter sp. CFBP9032]|uniref:sensor histidine kinase n=1 Tax=Pedobacter sp. CFBP9032 TaxID=3096539 RepID=UPI002A6AE9BB|nr:histidine kinase [Pedobacter sp. CFBP9032]MDY0903411.1 histidine kinase [Pedobacter sp. CFBP9032]